MIVMQVLDVFLNGHKLCSAGVVLNDALSAIVSSVPRAEGCSCFVGASIGIAGDFAKWVDHKPLNIGDEITIKIRESDSADEPISIEKAPTQR